MRQIVLRISLVIVGTALALLGQVPKPETKALNSEKLQGPIKPYYRAAEKRLGKTGSERITGNATLSTGGAVGEQISFVLEFPGKIRITGQGKNAMYTGEDRDKKSPVETSLQDAVESMLEDSIDGFLSAVTEKATIRYVGSGLRLADPQTGAIRYGDLVQVSRNERAGKASRGLTKDYWFDSATQRLWQVRYWDQGPKAEPIVTILEDYVSSGDLVIARRIRRLRGNQEQLKIEITTAQLSAKTSDQVFAK